MIVSPGIGSFNGSADNWFEMQGDPRRVAVSAPSFFIAKEYLKHSDLVGFIPSRLLPCDGLLDIPLDKYPPSYEVVAAYHPSAKHDPLIHWLVNPITSQFS